MSLDTYCPFCKKEVSDVPTSVCVNGDVTMHCVECDLTFTIHLKVWDRDVEVEPA
jgi:transcription elongation factor Elf1